MEEEEKIIEVILKSRPELTRENLEYLIKEKVKTSGGYLTRESALKIIASDLGVKIESSKVGVKTPISKLVSGLSDVTVVGRVAIIYTCKTFKKSDGSTGKVCRLNVIDKSGSTIVVLWDDKVDFVEMGKIKEGDIIRIAHAYTREGLGGEVEVHVGAKSEIQINPEDINTKDYPEIESLTYKIGDLKPEMQYVNISGIVKKVFSLSEFKRSNGTTGRVLRFILSDETGTITCVLWNEAAEKLRNLKEGDYVSIKNATLRERITRELEVHVNEAKFVSVSEKTPEKLKKMLKYVKVGRISEEMRYIDVLVKVLRVKPQREFRGGKVSSLIVGDESGVIILNLWGELSNKSHEIKPGDILLIRGGKVKKRDGFLSLNVGNGGSIEVNPEVKDVSVPEVRFKEVSIAQVEKTEEPITVKGIVDTEPELREVLTSSGRIVNVSSFMLRDETGRIRVSLWRDLADEALNLKIGDNIRLCNFYVRHGPMGIELTSGALSYIEVIRQKSL